MSGPEFRIGNFSATQNGSTNIKSTKRLIRSSVSNSPCCYGQHPHQGCDYDQTFIPVVKIVTLSHNVGNRTDEQLRD